MVCHSPPWSPILEKYFTSIQMLSRTIFCSDIRICPPVLPVWLHEVDFLNCWPGWKGENGQRETNRETGETDPSPSLPLPLSMTIVGYEYCSEFLRLKRVVFSQKIGSSSQTDRARSVSLTDIPYCSLSSSN